MPLAQLTTANAIQAFILFVCIVTVVAVPFIVSFESRLKPDAMVLLLDITLGLIELCFMLDVYMNFRIAYYSLAAGHFVLDRREIALRYARGMLLLDLLSCTPVTIVWQVFMDGQHTGDGRVQPWAILECAPTFCHFWLLFSLHCIFGPVSRSWCECRCVLNLFTRLLSSVYRVSTCKL